ncbi:MAG: hypothetical protein ACRD3Q_03150 [Terriglobales bacterium]
MPELKEPGRLAHLQSLDLSELRLTPAEAFVRAHVNGDPWRATIGMIGNRAVYRFLADSGTWVTVFGDDGSRLDHLQPASAVNIALSFDRDRFESSHQPKWIKEIPAVDQWTVFDYPMARPYLPFEIVSDNSGRRYYVSAASGSVYVVATRQERFWAYFGAIPHWWYLRALRAKPGVWQIVVIIGSGIGIISCLAGIVIGILQYSPSKRYRVPGPRNSSIPYIGWKRWHYWLGAIFGLVTFTWILSGFFTMNPSNSPGPDPSSTEARVFAGRALDPHQFVVAPAQALTRLVHCLQPVELELIIFQGEPYYLAKDSRGQSRLLSAKATSGDCVTDLPAQALLTASLRVVANTPVKDSRLLTQYDTYYYNDPTFSRPLPVFRVRFRDPHQTWLYANPRTGRIQAVYTEHARLQRWLYEGLHDLHFPILFRHRLSWRLTVIVLCLGGLILSVTSIILAQTYLRKNIQRRLRKARETRLSSSVAR